MDRIFRDRIEAAEELAGELSEFKNTDAVVLAIPRGGVPVGYVIARELHVPLDIALSKKIGHPGHQEYAIGAVSLYGMILNPEAGVSSEYIDQEVQRIRESLKERYRLFKGDALPVNLRNKTVIITDDGIATGNTMFATIEMVRKQNPAEIIVAVPVAPPQTVWKLEEKADKVVVLYAPEYFVGVGQFYEDFGQTSDEEVIALLYEAEKLEHRNTDKE